MNISVLLNWQLCLTVLLAHTHTHTHRHNLDKIGVSVSIKKISDRFRMNDSIEAGKVIKPNANKNEF